jgi:hypothetical protein
MRRFTDEAGRDWDVVVGRESFGALYALFVPAAGNAEQTRQALLRSESPLEAGAELDALSDADLNDLLQRSEAKGMA